MTDSIKIDDTLLAEPGGVIHFSLAKSVVDEAALSPCRTCELRQGCVVECAKFNSYVNTPPWQRGRRKKADGPKTA